MASIGLLLIALGSALLYIGLHGVPSLAIAPSGIAPSTVTLPATTATSASGGST